MNKLKKWIGRIGSVVTWPTYLIANVLLKLIDWGLAYLPTIIIFFLDVYMVVYSLIFTPEEMTGGWWANILGLSITCAVLMQIFWEPAVMLLEIVMTPLYNVHVFFWNMLQNAKGEELIQEYLRNRREQTASNSGQDQGGWQQSYQNSSIQHPDGYEEARTLFMLEDGFTKEELKQQYHRLLKVFHPDEQNGSTEYTKRITAAYGTLKSFAR